jgi:N-acetylglucosaminyldiphosphoundecaprenol N-acetyl-beta-D-mannosaminyltransferase
MDRARQEGNAAVLGTVVDAASAEVYTERMVTWARRGESRCVCACNVHTVVSAQLNRDFAWVVDHADLRVPDGAPIAWRLRRQGYSRQQRVSGPDLMWRCCARAAEEGLPVFLYGSSIDTLTRLEETLRRAFPTLRIAGSLAPPYRPTNAEEDARLVREIARSGARFVFVGLGCPKQEAWMLYHREAIPAVMLGAGAAFDFHAGTVKRAPRWMQSAGLEWLHRLCQQPGRLWKRYLLTNTLFIAWTLGEMLGVRARGRTSHESPANHTLRRVGNPALAAVKGTFSQTVARPQRRTHAASTDGQALERAERRWRHTDRRASGRLQ